ncbi:MAG: alkaline phosphatase family protein [Acidobacteria bacterium]|nr:alkaline phosphatase family protein [Acidobacteriota bacterium]MDA1233455.1 alkaline phosphatase family protein [Acidobacteriota bacterium]
MRRLLLLTLLLLPAVALLRAQAPQAPPQEPKLILFVAIDQFRYDYLPRFRDEYKGGLKTLLDRGAVFANAHLEHYPSVTAVGHSTMMSGATPAISGIIGNDWYDRETSKQVTSVSDPLGKLLGAAGEASSPKRLLVSTIGDELKRSGSPDSKVIGISMKDRGAILPAGHMADAAYWFDNASGAFVSSDYYFPQTPAWVQAFNAAGHVKEYAGKTWVAGRTMPTEPGPKLNAAVYGSSYGNDLLESFAEDLIREEKLGQRGVTDVLTVGFSSNDSVGHTYGPDSPEAHAVSVGVDGSLGRLFAAVESAVGIENVLVVLTADHSVSPLPEVLESQKMPGGRVLGDFFAPARAALEAKYGPGNWIEATAGTSPYFNYKLMDEQGVDRAEAEDIVAAVMREHPQVARVYTRQQILAGRAAYDAIDSRVLRSFNPQRSGDLEIVLNPFWIRSTSGTTHGSPYNYDTHIPLIFMGPGIKPGRYYKAAALNDAAPTIAALLDIEMPSGSLGRILDEIIK